MNGDGIKIKGIRQGLIVTLGSAAENWEDDLRALSERLGENPAFFRGGRVALDVGARELDRDQIERVRSILARNQVELWGVIGSSGATEAAAHALGLATDVPIPEPAPPAEVVEVESEQQPVEEAPLREGLVVRRTLRAGQRLRYPGHVVVIGDVNPGAEIVAGGNIVVWGRVRGVVHAGALGDAEAVVCALDLSPTQLRIAGHIARAPEEKGRSPIPEMASVQEGRIVAEPCQESRPGLLRSLLGQG